ENDDAAEEQQAIVLSVEHTVLGRSKRSIPRPDVDAFLKRVGPPKGYSTPALPAYVLALLINNTDALSPVLSFGAQSISLAQAAGHLRDISVFRSLRMADDNSPIRLVDVWFVDSHTLRLRIDAFHASLPGESITFRFYQPADSGAAGRIVLTDEETISPSE